MKRICLSLLVVLLAFEFSRIPLSQPAAGVPALSVALQPGSRVDISWPSSVTNYLLEESVTLGSTASWQTVPLTPVSQGATFSVTLSLSGSARFYRLRQSVPASSFRVMKTEPLDGAVEVGVTFRPKVTFSEPINPASLTSANFYATAAGRVLDATIVPSNDGTFAWLFFKSAMPGGTRVVVTVDGSTILSAGSGAILDPDGDGVVGGTADYEFTTVSLNAVAGTSLTGIVTDPGPDRIPRTPDDAEPGVDGQMGTPDDRFLLPIAGVKVFLLGREDDVVITGPDGRFHFDAVPVGNVKVAVDGRTAINAPPGYYFPEMVIDAQMIAGIENHTMTNGVEVYLPRLSQNILQAVDSATPTLIRTTVDGAQELSAFQRAQLTIELPANSLLGADGQKLSSGQVGISTVPPDLVREMLPPGVLQHTFDITVQAPGVATFSQPAPMTFPNVFNAAPGTKLNFLSFDHTTGRLVIDGTATVSADGATVRTDPGTGITRPGWHGLTPPGGPAGPDGEPAACEIDLEDTGVSALFLPPPVERPVALPMITGQSGSLSHPRLTWTAPARDLDVCGLKVQIEVDGPLEKFMKKTGNLALKSQTFTLRPGSGKTNTFKGQAKTYDEMFGKGKVANLFYDELFGAKITVRTTFIRSFGPSAVSTNIFYLYRWVNLTYPEDFLAGSGNIMAFRKTLLDGPKNWSSIKTILTFLPKTVSTDFAIQEPTHSGGVFTFHLPIEEGQLQLEFDPVARVPFPPLPELEINAGDEVGTEVGTLSLYGRGVEPTKVNLNLPGYKDELKRVLSTMQNITLTKPLPNPGLVVPVYTYGLAATDLPSVVFHDTVTGPNGVLVPQHVLNNVAGGAKGFLEGPDGKLGTADDVPYERYIFPGNVFAVTFRDFLPGKRAILGPDGVGGSLDDTFSPAQLAALEPRLDAEADALLLAVARQFRQVNFEPNPVQFVTTGADINLQWTDVFRILDGKSAYGPAASGRSQYGETEIVARDEEQLQKLLPNPRLPLGAKVWALAEGLRNVEKNLVRVSVARHVSYIGTNTFAEYVANTVSHELGHTLGLVDAYTEDGKVGSARCRLSDHNCIPFDIMRGGSINDPLLNFAPVNLGLLHAALGVSHTAAGPDSYSKNEPGLLAELAQYRKTFNLADSSTGIRENVPLDPPPTQPEISIFQGSHSFFGEPDEDLEIEGKVPADGTGGEFTELVFTIMNAGYGPLNVHSLSLENGNSGFFVMNNSTDSDGPILAGGTNTFTLRFDPSIAGPASNALVVASDAASNPLLRIPVHASAYENAPTIQVELAGNNNFGGVSLGATSLSITNVFRLSNQGNLALRVERVALVEGSADFALAGVPNNLENQPIQVAHGKSILFGGTFHPNQGGLRRAIIEIKTNDPQTPVVRVSFVGTGVKHPMTADWGDDFIAIEAPDLPSAGVLRTKSDTKGNFEFFLSPLEFYHLAIFDPVTGLIGHETGTTEPSGQRTGLANTMFFMGSIEPDSDFDGLPDDIEFSIGSNRFQRDTDADGVDDFSSVTQGLDPLGGRAMPVGVVGGADIRGFANKVVVLPASANQPKTIALVAAGTNGLVIVDVTKPSTPILLSQIAVNGEAVDIGADPQSRIAFVAAGEGGAHFVDVSSPSSPKLLRSTNWKARHVEVVEGIAYVSEGYGDKLVAFDLVTGQTLQTIELGATSVGAIAHESSTVYLIGTNSSTLRLIDIRANTMRESSAITLEPPDVRGPLRWPVVQNGMAYLTLNNPAGLDGQGGYVTVDVSNTNALKLVGGTDVPISSRVPGQALALSGSGIGILVGSLQALETIHAMDVLDVSQPTNTYSLIRRITLPGPPQSVTIHAGLAYVACGTNGLAVVNYLPFDGEGRAPTVSIGTTALDADSAQPGLQVVEGTPIPIQADVRDDVQVQKVELLVDGRVIQTSTAVPFDLRAVAPPASAAPISIQVRAIDTGGNSALSQPLVIESIADSVPFEIEDLDPRPKQIIPTDYGVIDITFSKAVRPETVSNDNFFILNSNNQLMPLRDIEIRNEGRLIRLRWDQLPSDMYSYVLRAPAIRDYSGNALGVEPLTNRFTTYPFTMRWTGARGPFRLDRALPRIPYSFFNPTNWYPQRSPGSNDAVFINLPRTNTFREGLLVITTNISAVWVGDTKAVPDAVELRALVSNEAFGLHNLNLKVRELFQVNNRVDLFAAYLRETVVLGGPDTLFGNRTYLPGASPLTGDGYYALLNRVSLKGDFQFEEAQYDVLGRLTLDGTLRSLGLNGNNAAFLTFDKDAVLDGAGTYYDTSLLPSVNRIRPDFDARVAVTIESNVVFRGHFNFTLDAGSKLINRGQLLADRRLPRDEVSAVSNPGTYFSQIRMLGNFDSLNPRERFVNEGTVEVSNGYSFEIAGEAWDLMSSPGTLRVLDTGYLYLTAPLTTPGIVCAVGGVCYLRGGSKYPLRTAPGQVTELSGGGRWYSDRAYQGGTIRLTNGAVLEGVARFNDVTFEGELHNYDWQQRGKQFPDIPGYGIQIDVATNLTLNGAIYFHRDASSGNPGYLYFGAGVQRLEGQGRIEFEGHQPLAHQIGKLTGFGGPNFIDLRIGPGISIHGENLDVGNSGGSSTFGYYVENRGTFVTLTGDSLLLSAFSFTNSGLIKIGASNTVTASSFTQTTNGTIEFAIAGTNAGTNHGYVRIAGNATLAGTVSAQPTSNYQWKLGDLFELITYRTYSATFDNVDGGNLPAQLQLTPEYQSTAFRLKVTGSSVPSAEAGREKIFSP